VESVQPIGYLLESECSLQINADVAAQLGITIPAELQAQLDAQE